MRKTRIRKICEIAILVSLLAVVSQISIPMPFLVPITIQVLLVSLIGYLLRTREAVITMLSYIIIGAIGVPVFANFGAGVGTLFGYTGGFVFGFLPLVILASLGRGKIKILYGILGVVLCHIIGILQYSLVSKMGIITSLVTMSLPYILKDIVLAIVAYFLSALIKTKLKKQG